jgi:signal transduction histidine kinase
MTGARPATRLRPPARLRARIVVLISGFAGVMFLLVAMVGWLVVLEAEDAILEAGLDEAIDTATNPAPAVSPDWYRAFESEEQLRKHLNLDRVPAQSGTFEVFASPQGNRAIWVRDWSSRWQMWRAENLEQEYRLVVDLSDSSQPYRLIDLAGFEFTESRVEAIQKSILIAAMAVAGAALLLSYLIARWTLWPILRLAEAVGRREHEEVGEKLAESFPDDEIGFLAQALDDAEASARAALERERRFISDCSHELRTPVATLKSALTLTEELADDPAHRAKVEARMRRAVDWMERLVQLFLVLAREGREPAPDGQVGLRQIITEVVEEQAVLHQPRVMMTEINVPAGQTVLGRRDVVLVLIQNFVANVWRHAGGDRLRFQWVAGEVLRIDDNGVGFPGSNQAESRHADSSGFGVGLGLAARLCGTQGWSLRRGQSELGGARIEIVFAANRLDQVQ